MGTAYMKVIMAVIVDVWRDGEPVRPGHAFDGRVVRRIHTEVCESAIILFAYIDDGVSELVPEESEFPKIRSV